MDRSKNIRTIVQVIVFSGIAISFPSAKTVSEDELFSSAPPEHGAPWHKPVDSISTDMNDYAWPTSAPQIITSSFADFRSSHFHEGIDISTEHRTGAKVFASRDGYVEHISVSPYGYGRYLVLRHRDGYYTAYAHLKAFNHTIEGIVRSEQTKKGKFSVELEFQPNDIIVHKGEVIAYSGESGVGGPHLHFEIRDENFNPVNPLLFPNIGDTKDTHPPLFRRLAVTPIDESSFVDYRFETKIYHVHSSVGHRFIIPETIHATGKIGFSVDAIDPGNGTRYKTSVYSLELQIDGKTFFSSKRDRFPDDETRQIGIDYDYQLYKERRGRFQKLYIDNGNTLPFYDHKNFSDGFVSLKNVSEGKHSFHILATDFVGNMAQLEGSFVINHPPTVSIVGMKQNALELQIPNSDSISAIELSGKRLSLNNWKSIEFPASRFSIAGRPLLIPLPHGDYDVVRVVAQNIWKTKSFPVFYFLKKPAISSPVKISRDLEGNIMNVNIKSTVPFTATPSARILQGTNVTFVPLHSLDMNSYTGTCLLLPSYSGTTYIEATCETGGKAQEARDSITLTAITPESGGTITSDDGNFSLTFEKNSCYAPEHFSVTQLQEGKYSVKPSDILLKSGLTASIGFPQTGVERTLRMYVNYGAGWRILPSVVDWQERKIIVNSTRSLGKFGLYADTRKPVIRRWRSSHYNEPLQPLFSFSVRDNFSGVDPDQITILLNGARVIAEYDPERRIVFYTPYEPVPRGRYAVSIEVKDRVGNATHQTETLIVYR